MVTRVMRQRYIQWADVIAHETGKEVRLNNWQSIWDLLDSEPVLFRQLQTHTFKPEEAHV